MVVPVSCEPQRSIDWLKSPIQWQHWPYCPVKRAVEGGGFPDLGIVVDEDPTTVLEMNLYQIGDKDAWDNCPKHKYESVEAMADDGWLVD